MSEAICGSVQGTRISLRSSGLPKRSTKFRRAFLAEGATAFLGFLGAVVERDRLEAERAQAAQLLCVGIERTLGDRDRGRASLLELGAPAIDLLVELVRRDHGVDQTHLVGLFRTVAAAEVP